MRLTARQTATVLAALRFWQRHVAPDYDVEPGDPVNFLPAEVAGHFNDSCTPLAVSEIDQLCERINA